MYSRRPHETESEDERLARRLQEEEERSLSNRIPNNHSNVAAMSDYSAQEEEDMILARQMAQIDSYGGGNERDPHRHRREQMISDYSGGGGQRQRMCAPAAEPPGAYGIGDYNRRPTYSPSGLGDSGRIGAPARGYNMGVGAGGSGDREDRLAYARRLQEEAFQRVQASSRPQPEKPKSTEESDLELAMKMQIEESDPINAEQEDEDMKLARFMEESGVSIRDLDEAGLAALKEQGLGALNLPKPPVTNRGGLSSLGLGGGGGGGALGGLYGGNRDDDSDDDSIELGFGGRGGLRRPNQTPPAAGIPASIPPPDRSKDSMPAGILPASSAARKPLPPASIPSNTPPVGIPPPVPPASIPSAIPPASVAIPPSSIPSAIPPLTTSPRRSPPGGSTPLSIPAPGTNQPSPRLMPASGAPRREFQRQLPGASKSSGPGSPSGSGGLTRTLPAASKSFGKTRSGIEMPSRSPPGHSRSGMGLRGMRNHARGTHDNSPRETDRSLSPNRRGKNHRRNKSQDHNLVPPMLDDLPPGVNLPSANDPGGLLNEGGDASTPAHGKKEKKKGKLLKRFFGGKNNDAKQNAQNNEIPEGIPAAIPDRPGGTEAGPLPHSVSVSRNIAQNALRSSFTSPDKKPTSVCSVCGGRSGKMLMAMDRKFHVECFRCMSCNEVIDPTSVFAVSVDPMGEQQPLHRKCYAEFYGVQCAVCKKAIPANEDGSVSFIKHPFFNTEQMCPCHADEPGRRRCTGCHRFEPEDEPFADLGDGGRCVCYACVRTVIMNNMDVKPLWLEVLRFFEFQLGLPIWEEMREIPILVVGQDALNETQSSSVHGDSSQIMTRGLCLSEHDGNMSFRVPSQRFNESISTFEACNHSGFIDFDIGHLKGNSNSEVMAILCLSGLPRDLTASVLAHEATHAWIKLHPDFKVRKSLPPQVEEGCAQLVAYLFLSEGLEAPRRNSGGGPSDEKLRQYFKFSIETDDNEIYGEGYRKAAMAYATIGIEALLNHVVHFQEFPNC